MKIVGFLLFFFVSVGLAESADRTGPYIAVGGGYAVFDDDKRMGSGTIDPSYNLNIIGGVFINKYLSVELALDYYDTFQNQAGDTTKIYIYDAATKAHYSFWRERIDLYAAFGAGGIKWEEMLSGVPQDSSSGALRGDIGAGYRIVDWVTLNIGYRRYFFTLDQVDETSGLVIQQYHMNLNSVYTNIEVQF